MIEYVRIHYKNNKSIVHEIRAEEKVCNDVEAFAPMERFKPPSRGTAWLQRQKTLTTVAKVSSQWPSAPSIDGH